jgi:hypothetical protein
MHPSLFVFHIKEKNQLPNQQEEKIRYKSMVTPVDRGGFCDMQGGFCAG